MTFGRCIGGEPEPFFSTAAREVPHSRLRMRHLLPWSRSHQKQTPQTPPTTPDEPCSKNQENTTKFRRGEKSFLDFHQQYAITKHLGEGSYSTVKQVTHRKKGGLFACKIVDKLSLSPVDRTALSQEVSVLKRVQHEHIMRLYDVIEDDAKCYLIMELADQGDLFDKIVKQGKFPPTEAQKVAGALVEALHYCHENSIIHRDVKPENVLLSLDGNVKLCDFGFAKQLEHRQEQSVDSCGTPGYAAPEILDGKPYGVEVDVFSLGVVTYIMLCGYPPFPMKLSQLRTHRFNVRFPSKDWNQIDQSVKDLIAEMLSVNPQKRPSMSDLRAHPWIQQGKQILDTIREAAEARRQADELQRKQQLADAIRLKIMSNNGLEAVKYGRNGLPHRTKLRLSNDGLELMWQPKLLKRGLLRYHNARGLASFFGGGSSSSDKQTNQPSPRLMQLHPRISRLSSYDAGGRRSEPIVSDETDLASFTSSLSVSGSSTSTTTTSTSDVIQEKKNWWRSFRRDRNKTERSASGGFSFPFTRPSAASFDGNSTPTTPQAVLSPMGILAAKTASPLGSSTHSEKSLDTSIHLSDVLQVLSGDQSHFFITTNDKSTAQSPKSPHARQKRKENLDAVVSIVTTYRELHLEFANAEMRDGFAFFLQTSVAKLIKPKLFSSTSSSSSSCSIPTTPTTRNQKSSSASSSYDNTTEIEAMLSNDKESENDKQEPEQTDDEEEKTTTLSLNNQQEA